MEIQAKNGRVSMFAGAVSHLRHESQDRCGRTLVICPFSMLRCGSIASSQCRKTEGGAGRKSGEAERSGSERVLQKNDGAGGR